MKNRRADERSGPAGGDTEPTQNVTGSRAANCFTQSKQMNSGKTKLVSMFLEGM